MRDARCRMAVALVGKVDGGGLEGFVWGTEPLCGPAMLLVDCRTIDGRRRIRDEGPRIDVCLGSNIDY